MTNKPTGQARTGPWHMAWAAAAVLAGCSTASPTLREGEVSITRTAFGVPHILAHDEAGLGRGVGHAYAQDNLCLLAEFLVTVNAERSRHFGPQGTPDPNGRGAGNLASDVYHGHLNAPARVNASWARQPANLQQLLQGFARGYNERLRQARDEGTVPAACQGRPWVREITALDLVRLHRRYAVEASGAKFMDAFHTARPPGQAPAAVAGAAADWPDFTPWRSAMGSNALALGRAATTSGAGLLLANPHYPWHNGFRFYQMHLSIPGRLDVFGGALPGLPLVNIGFNAQLAWTHTVSTATHFTLFALQLDPADPTRYVVDGESRPMAREDVVVAVSDGQGGTQQVTHAVYLTEHGPVVALPGGLGWTATTAYALADANAENDRMLQQWWDMNRAPSLEAFRTAVTTRVGLPWVTTVAADAGGQVFFADVSTVPHVTAAQRTACVAAAHAPLLAKGIVVLDGSTARCGWGADADAPVPGIFGAARLPTLVRDDYVQNSNNSAWLTHPDQPLSGFSPMACADGVPLNGRGRLGLSDVAARLAGTDGLPGRGFDLASLQQMALSNRSFHATSLLADLRLACEGGGTATLPDGAVVDLVKGCGVLAGWDGTANLESVGWPLFNAWRGALVAMGATETDRQFWQVPFDPADAVRTPRGLRVADPVVRGQVRQALAQAMQRLDGQGVDYTRPWQDLHVAVFDGTRLPMHGGAGDDIYNAMGGSVRPGTGQAEVLAGSSLLLAVSFEGGRPTAEGFLTYSLSTDPASPHRMDQTRQFAGKRWIRYPFTPEEIAADPARHTVRLRP